MPPSSRSSRPSKSILPPAESFERETLSNEKAAARCSAKRLRRKGGGVHVCGPIRDFSEVHAPGKIIPLYLRLRAQTLRGLFKKGKATGNRKRGSQLLYKSHTPVRFGSWKGVSCMRKHQEEKGELKVGPFTGAWPAAKSLARDFAPTFYAYLNTFWTVRQGYFSIIWKFL